MEDTTGACLAGSSEQREVGMPPSKTTVEVSAQGLTDSYANNNGSMSTVPEDSDEVWSDAQEPVDSDEDVGLAGRDIEEVGDDHDGRSSRASVYVAPSGLDTGEDELKDARSDGKGFEKAIMTNSIEDTRSSMAGPEESSTQAADDAVSPASVVTNAASSTPVGLANVESAASLEVPTSSASSRAISPTPTQRSGSALDRRQSRRRSVIDGRATNRFSGFLSNLIHRRPDHPSVSSASPSLRGERESSTVTKGESSSRASSPTLPARSVTPPPPLPAPSLQELGLCLNAITSIITPSHFNTPPSSGTFLGPHYLLLCHTQGLDVLPLVSPPAPQPYALVRRVSFKSVVIMEEKGVLVAIAGRRDGVRVYGLEDVKKAVEWRVDVEIRREKERVRREEAKRGTAGGVDKVFGDLKPKGLGFEDEKTSRTKSIDSPTTPTPSTPKPRKRKSSIGLSEPSVPPLPRPRAPTITRRSTRTPSREARASHHDSDPPPYQSPSSARPNLHNQASVISISQNRSRSGSVTNVIAGGLVRRRSAVTMPRGEEKGDWEHYSSDDEAINMASAGPGGSAALDERTSSMTTGNTLGGTSAGIAVDGGQSAASLDVPGFTETLRRSQTASTTVSAVGRRGRPAQLDLALSRTSTANDTVSRPPPSPTPSVWTLRQALSSVPPGEDNTRSTASDVDGEDEDDDCDAEPISFSQALMESRLPNLPPPGTQQPQEPILINALQSFREPQSPRGTSTDVHTIRSTDSGRTLSRRSRRRWSVLDGVFSQSGSNDSVRTSSRPGTPSVRPLTPAESSINGRSSNTLTRVTSTDGFLLQQPFLRDQSFSAPRSRPGTAGSAPPSTLQGQPPAPSTPSHHRFLPRLITNAFNTRRSDEQPSPGGKSLPGDSTKRPVGNAVAPLPPAPKLEYVKLPGTKGAVMIKAVETAKKSFLAILCGENGEKVELFAGTYRTTLGLSRTFILPDSPRSLELQLQGDDLVEVFLVFAQNVFGLEPATVRVREVRVGRAERRAARRRARETRVEELVSTEVNAPALGDEDATDANVSVGVDLTSSATSQTFNESSLNLPSMSRQVSDSNMNASASGQQHPTTSASQSEELAALATAHLAPYTTFQQLPFAPQFPLGTIADECIIPPTYRSFLEYRAQYEPEPDGLNNLDLASVQFSPPGLPVPSTLPPSKWFYRDPKGVVQGPWKASLMQTWYKDGLLPPDLPVRREEDTEYCLLKDLRAHSVDPSHPFRARPPPLKSFSFPSEPVKPLLDPISLLTQPRRYGPPALFYTTRGGHSTSIVDARGRSVLRGRLQWSIDEDENFSAYGNRLGDVKRLEAFDIDSNAVIVAIRQGGLEVTEVADALMGPGDLSRALLPNFHPNQSSVSRRSPFIWKIGSPLSAFAVGPVSSEQKTNAQAPNYKKHGLGIGKPPPKNEFALGNSDDYEGRQHEELLFLGRVDDNVYFCERSNGSFRILRLCPNTS
ncbi:hypothetical protein M0805_004778 [Coniferiporia weirii]|nr:hypothetical protein M0805_004778 [Coniferiporia weirii]